MNVANKGSQDSGEYHGPQIVGSFSLLTNKGSSNLSMVPFELWLTANPVPEQLVCPDLCTLQSLSNGVAL